MMPTCSRGVTFPVKKLFDSFVIVPGDLFFVPGPGQISIQDAISVAKFPNIPISDETEQLLRLMFDRHTEQLKLCGGKMGRGKIVRHLKVGPFFSHVRFSDTGGQIINSEYRPVNNMPKATETSFELVFSGSDFVGNHSEKGFLRLRAGENGYIQMRFGVGAGYRKFRVFKIESRHLENVIHAIDPTGTGYEFITPDDLTAYDQSFPTPESQKNHSLISPQLRYNRTPPSLLNLMKQNFEENHYPALTEAYKAFRPNIISPTGTTRTRMKWKLNEDGYYRPYRPEETPEERSSKRRRFGWEIGATGYRLN